MIRKSLALLLVLAPMAAYAQAPAPASKKPASPVDEGNLPEVVAKVNGVDIKKTELTTVVDTLKAQLQLVGQSVPADKKDEMYRGLLEDLINRELLAQEASKAKISVPDAELETFVQEFKDRFPSEEVFQRALKEQGISEAQLKIDVRKEMQIKKLLDKEVFAKAAVDDAAIKKFYKDNPDKFQEPEQVKASHVLVSVEKTADEKTRAAAKKEAEQVLKDAKAGKDFAALAKEHSDDPGSKDNGGDLGYFPRGEMVPQFEEAAFKLEKNQFSDVVETPYGFHVIKVVDKKAPKMRALDEVKERVGGFLQEQKAQELAKVYLENLRKKAKVQIFI